MLRFHSAARKHEVSTRDIERAVRHAMVVDALNDGKRLYLGPGLDGTLLEVVTQSQGGKSEIAIHAMKMRRKYRSLLAGEGI
jgi:hypothetical protein